jgi:hypothetical protein
VKTLPCLPDDPCDDDDDDDDEMTCDVTQKKLNTSGVCFSFNIVDFIENNPVIQQSKILSLVKIINYCLTCRGKQSEHTRGGHNK